MVEYVFEIRFYEKIFYTTCHAKPKFGNIFLNIIFKLWICYVNFAKSSCQ